jgi:hypothetical protein
MSESAAKAETESRDDAQLTDAQKEQAGQAGPPQLSEEAKRVAQEDADWRAEHPNEVRTREANPAVGGESFGYLGGVSG